MSVERSPKLITPYLAVYLFVISLTFYLTMNYWPQTNIDSMKKVRIDHGTTLSTISDKLNKKGLVSNKWVFEFLTKIKGLEKSMQAGIFRISNVHTNNDVINNNFPINDNDSNENNYKPVLFQPTEPYDENAGLAD